MNSTEKKPQVLNISLWIAQIVLGLMFLMAGFMKSTTPIDQLAVDVPSEGHSRMVGAVHWNF